MVLNNWVGFFTCLRKCHMLQKFLWQSRRMLMDGALYPFNCESWVKGATGSWDKSEVLPFSQVQTVGYSHERSHPAGVSILPADKTCVLYPWRLTQTNPNQRGWSALHELLRVPVVWMAAGKGCPSADTKRAAEKVGSQSKNCLSQIWKSCHLTGASQLWQKLWNCSWWGQGSTGHMCECTEL